MSEATTAITADSTPIYFRVSPALWRKRTWTDDMRLLACYLLTSPHRTLEGLFWLPKAYICGDLQWSPERLEEPFAGLSTDGFLAYDDEAEVCLIVKALKYQRPENPNMDKAGIRRVATVSATPLDALFLSSAERYAQRFSKRLREGLPERFGKPQLCSTQLYSTQPSSSREADPVENPEPVDNSAAQERGGSIDQEEQGAGPPAVPLNDPGSCDGSECLVRCFPATAFGPLRRAMLASLKPEQFKEVGTGGDLDQVVEQYARHICAACQADLGEFDRPQRDELCERALLVGVENLKGASDVKAVMRSRLQRYGLLQLTDDRTVEELRRTKRDKRRKGEPRALADCLPPAFAQPQGAAKGFDPAESGAA